MIENHLCKIYAFSVCHLCLSACYPQEADLCRRHIQDKKNLPNQRPQI